MHDERMSFNIPSPNSQSQDEECVLSSSQCTPQQSSVKSELSSQVDRCADKSLADRVSDAEALPKKLPVDEGLFLRKISKMIANEKWRALEWVLWSSSNDNKSCGYVPDDVGDAVDDDEVSSLRIGKCAS
jgi:hypothetical protein